MNNEMKERLSAFIDGEVHNNDIVDKLEHDKEMRATMARYSLIGDVLNNRYASGSHELAAKVHDALDAEATLIAPRQWMQKPRLMKQAAGLAMAATVAAVAILVVGNFSPTTATGVSVAISPVAVGPITDKPIRMTSAVQRKLNGYLISHTEYSASDQMKGMLPYTRIASFTAGQRSVSPSAATGAGAVLEE